MDCGLVVAATKTDATDIAERRSQQVNVSRRQTEVLERVHIPTSHFTRIHKHAGMTQS